MEAERLLTSMATQYPPIIMRTTFVILLLALASCQAIHRTPDTKVGMLKVGMTTSEVEKLLGRPWHAIVRPFQTRNRETLEYLLTRDTRMIKETNHVDDSDLYRSRSYHRVLVLEFVDGVLVAGKGASSIEEAREDTAHRGQ